MTGLGIVGPAGADPGHGRGHGQESAPAHGKRTGKSDQEHRGAHGKPRGKAHGQDRGVGPGSGHAATSARGQGSRGAGPHGGRGGAGDPPHVGCVFDVEWYGFDEGADIVSDVTFESWAPTRVPMTVDGPTQVFVGGDPASGAGTDEGFDGEATYRLAFDGEPHPQQGYHVKLTIHTPGSRGADVKHKVFWVEDCTEAPGEETPEQPSTPGTPQQPGTPETPEVAGEQEVDSPSEPDEVEVKGEQAVAPQAAPGTAGTSTVPSSVDAGLDADRRAAVSSALVPPLVALLGLLVTAIAVAARRRVS